METVEKYIIIAAKVHKLNISAANSKRRVHTSDASNASDAGEVGLGLASVSASPPSTPGNL